jgi:replicative DNA helicase
MEQSMKLFEQEQLLIGIVLKFGKSAYKLVDFLEPDKFLFDSKGTFGQLEHVVIWRTIIQTVNQQKLEPTLTNVCLNLEPTLHGYTESCLALTQTRGVDSLDADLLLNLANTIQKSGTVYHVSQMGLQLSSYTKTLNQFELIVSGVDDIDQWLVNIFSKVNQYYDDGSRKGGYYHISDYLPAVYDRWDALYAGHQVVLLPCGIPSMIQAQLLPLGSFSILQGHTGSGKTTLALQYALGVAIGLKKQGIEGKVAINSLEMSATSLIERCGAILSGIDYTRLRGGKRKLSPEEFEKLKQGVQQVQELPIYIDESSLITTNAQQYRALGLNATPGGPIYLLVADYSELFADEGESREQEVHRVARNEFALSRLIGCATILLAQSVTKNATLIAGLDGIRYSRGSSHSADIVMEIYNPPQMVKMGLAFTPPPELDASLAHLLVEKGREGTVLGNIDFIWQPECTRFIDVGYNRELKHFDEQHYQTFVHESEEIPF